jgi:signal transduction histidine kinase
MRSKGPAWAPRSFRLKTAALILACWATFGVLLGEQMYALQAGQGPAAVWSHALVLQLNYCLVWAVATPAVLWMGRRFPLVAPVQARFALWRSLAVHLLAGICCALIVQSVHSRLLPLLYPRWFPPVPFSLLRRSLMSTVDYGSILYWVVLLTGQSVDYLRRSNETRIRQAELQEQLAEAHLQALRMQMHPHFLFNALNSVAALIPENPRAAEHMLTRLGELLRIYLRSSELQEISLAQEIDFLRRYLEIQKLRFEERLHVHIRLDPAAQTAAVPSLILQPLVENAIVHGIADRDCDGSIEIDAAAEGAQLSLRVADNGSGSQKPAPAGWREGTGLGNTRRRLERIYGPRHGFSVEALANGGTRASIRIPLKQLPARST